MAYEVDQIKPGDVEGLQALFRDFRMFGSSDPSADFQALMKRDDLRPLALIEPYRVLMEPVFRYKGDDWGMAVTVFRPIRTMSASEVYNWLLKMACYPASFDNVAVVLDPAIRAYWRVYESDLRGKRIYYPDLDEIHQEQMLSGIPCTFEFVYLPQSLDPAEVDRAVDLTSQVISTEDYVIAWNFPEDPIRTWHDPNGVLRNPDAERVITAEADRFREILLAASRSQGMMEAIRARAKKRHVSLDKADVQKAVTTLRGLAEGEEFTPEQVQQAKAILVVVSEATLSYVNKIQGPPF